MDSKKSIKSGNGESGSESARSRESKERRERWRQIAVVISKRHRAWSGIQIARKIQRSNAGRKRDGVLTYSIDNIARSIRGAW
jgi:hypothetical protein